MTPSEHERLVAIEARQADLERRIAALEEAANRQVPWWPVPATDGTQWTGCPVCGRGADGKPDWFVCTRSDCPSAVTCFAGTPPGAAAVGQTPAHLIGSNVTFDGSAAPDSAKR